MLKLDKLPLEIDGNIPITFGSIGHRDALEEDLVIAATKVANVLKDYRQRFPKSPFLFLCPLAEGADIAITEEVSKIQDSELFILPTLPFGTEHYRQTISEEWRNRFDVLLEHPKSLRPLIISDDLLRDDESIKRYYQKAGEFIARYSHILFAIKDNWGTLERFIGGTANIIHYRKNGCTNPNILSRSNIRCAEEGHLYEIRVRRQGHALEQLDPEWCYNTPRYERDKNDNNESKNNAKSIVFASNKLGKFWFNIWIKNLFETISDQQSHLHDPDFIAYDTNVLNQTILSSRRSGRDYDLFSSGTNIYINELDNIASSLKIIYTKFHLYPAFIIAVFLALLETVDSLIGDKGTTKLFSQFTFDEATKILKFILITSIFAIGLSEFFNRFKHRFESTRAMCEALKVQDYWNKLGIEECAADYLLSAQIGDSSWVRRTIRSASIFDFELGQSRNKMSPNQLMHQLKDTKEKWISGQITFFTSRIKEYENKLRIFNLLSYICLALGIISYILSHEFISKYLHAPSILGGFYLLFFILFTLSKGFLEIQAYEVLVKRYRASKHIFIQVRNIYQNLLDSKETKKLSNLQMFKDLFLMLGISVLEEVSDWYVMSSRLKFKSPQG